MPKPKKLQLLNSERAVLRECVAVLKEWGLADHVRRQNVGGMTNESGQFVKFGKKGDSDLGGVLPSGWGKASGKRIVIELKREEWSPPYLYRITKARDHWWSQLSQLILVNKAGGYGFWCDDSGYLWKALHLIKQGYLVRICSNEQPEFYLDGEQA